MKTRNNVQKTKNNVQKTVLRSLAVVVSFVLISFTVTAQDFWKAVTVKLISTKLTTTANERKTVF